jgi:hypothetical protein
MSVRRTAGRRDRRAWSWRQVFREQRSALGFATSIVYLVLLFTALMISP